MGRPRLAALDVDAGEVAAAGRRRLRHGRPHAVGEGAGRLYGTSGTGERKGNGAVMGDGAVPLGAYGRIVSAT
jgi:hypothetical protein